MEEKKDLIKFSRQKNLPFEDLVKVIKERMQDGTNSPLEIMTFLKKVEKVSKELYNDVKIKQILSTEIARHISGRKSARIYNSKVSMRRQVKYNYLSSGHPEYIAIVNLLKELTIRKKQLETLLKDLHEPTELHINNIPSLIWENTIDDTGKGTLVSIDPPTLEYDYLTPSIQV